MEGREQQEEAPYSIYQQHTTFLLYSNRDTRRKPGREFDGIICFLERGKGEELVLCARLGQDFCPLHLQEDGKHAKYDCNIVIKKEEHHIWHNVNQISGNNEWQHGHDDKMRAL